MTDRELFDFHKQKLAELDPTLRERMIAHLLATIPAEAKEQIRAAITIEPLTWAYQHHFFYGMGIRNSLRQAGFGEHEYPQLGNLDDYWVALVEAAVSE